MTSKEALKELKNNFGLGVIGRSLCEIIEQDLEMLEKAIKILKNKLKLHHIKHSKLYTMWCEETRIMLSKQEYELLKEVLENDK